MTTDQSGGFFGCEGRKISKTPTKLERMALECLNNKPEGINRADLETHFGRSTGYLGNAPIGNPIRHAIYRLEMRGLAKLVGVGSTEYRVVAGDRRIDHARRAKLDSMKAAAPSGDIDVTRPHIEPAGMHGVTR